MDVNPFGVIRITFLRYDVMMCRSLSYEIRMDMHVLVAWFVVAAWR